MTHTLTTVRTAFLGSYVVSCSCGWSDDPTEHEELSALAGSDHLREARTKQRVAALFAETQAADERFAF